MKTMSAVDKLRWVRSQLLLASATSHPELVFFCELMSFPSYFAPVGTACTDGRVIAFDPKYIDSISREECLDLWLEETLHIALCHPHRAAGRNLKIWNEACDVAIWEILQSIGRKPIEGLCYIGPGCGARFKDLPRRETAEKYYGLLMDQRDKDKQSGQGQGQGQEDRNNKGRSGVAEFGSLKGVDGSDGQKSPECPEYLDGGTAELSGSLVQAFVQKAKESAKGRGAMSSAVDSLITGVNARCPDYRDVLRRYRRDVIKKGADWGRPNRRLMSSGIHAPSRRSLAVKDIVVLVDASGSITEHEISIALANVDRIYAEASNRVILLQHDTEVLESGEWRAGGRRPVFTRKLRGGTSHVKAFAHIAKKYPNAGVVICITDGDTSFPPVAPRFPVVWACTKEGKKFPFGVAARVYL